MWTVPIFENESKSGSKMAELLAVNNQAVENAASLTNLKVSLSAQAQDRSF